MKQTEDKQPSRPTREGLEAAARESLQALRGTVPADEALEADLDTEFDDGGTPLRHGTLRGDQQAAHTESQFGAVPKGTKHRGRD